LGLVYLGSSGNEMIKKTCEFKAKRRSERLFFQIEGHRVDTPALICGHLIPLTCKDMAQVRVAIGAPNFGPNPWGQ
jgi:hypothetical protein